MPFIRVTVSTRPSAGQTQALAEGVTRLMGDILAKKVPLTAVLIESAGDQWTIGAVRQAHAAHVEANITAGTNTPAQKSTFIAQMMALLRTTLGVLPEATYVIVREIPAGDWGYDGLTQAARAQSPSKS